MRLLDSPRDRAQAMLLLLGVAIIAAVQPFVPGLFGAGILYVVFDRAHRWLSRRLAPRPAAALVILVAAAGLAVPGVLLVMLVLDRVPGLLRELQQRSIVDRLATLQIAGVAIGAQIAAVSGALLSWLSRRGVEFAGGVMRATINLTVALFGLYYLLLATPLTWRGLEEVLPFSHASARRLRARFYSVTEAMLLGVVLTAGLQGTIVGLGFWVTGLGDGLFWGAITAFASVLPIFGSAFVWLPGTIVLAMQNRLGAAAVLLVLGAGIASNIDNLMRPIVYRRLSQIHPMTTVVGAFAGVAMFGLVGVLIGPLAISYFFELLKIYREEYQRPQAAAMPLEPSAITSGSPAAR